MRNAAVSIRPFIGSTDYDVSRNFYRDLGFEEVIISHDMCLFRINNLGFYLQAYHVKEWVDNTMLFLEVEDVKQYWDELTALDLPARYKGVRLHPIRTEEWGSECFLHDPSGILWHIGQFSK